MTRLSKTLFVAAALLAAPVSSALAQDAPPDGEQPAGGEGGEGMGGGEGGGAPMDGSQPAPPPDMGAAPMAMGTGPSLVVEKGKIQIMGSTLNINLSSDAVAKPVFLAPSIYYGVNEKLSVGVTHDSGTTVWTPRPALRFTTIDILGTPVQVAAGAGICITGEENGCPKVYDNIGLDAIYSIKAEKFSLAGHGGLDIFSFDPMILQLRAGVLGQYMASDKIGIVFDPRIRIGLTERDVNKEAIDVPVWFWFHANEKLAAYLHSGLNSTFENFGDNLIVPVGVGANYSLNDKLTVGADFHFVNLLGEGGDADFRILGLRAAYKI
jgi:hypothetical protein